VAARKSGFRRAGALLGLLVPRGEVLQGFVNHRLVLPIHIKQIGLPAASRAPFVIAALRYSQAAVLKRTAISLPFA
jgi:hypothetical protein